MKGGGIIAATLDKAHAERCALLWPSPSENNPYEGPQGEGYDAFHRGKARKQNPYGAPSFYSRKAQRWDGGWIKAKLAKEQGKKAL